MEDYVEIFRHIQPFEVEKVLIALQNEGISCYMEVAGPWGKSPVYNPDDYHSSPFASYYVLVRRDQYMEAREVVSKLLRDEIPRSPMRPKKPNPEFYRLRKIYALIVLLYTFALIVLTFWNLFYR
jgi:hypothetical protein